MKLEILDVGFKLIPENKADEHLIMDMFEDEVKAKEVSLKKGSKYLEFY